jgi:hypothetical protein
MSNKRNPDYPPAPLWDDCAHDWKDVESMSENEVRCKKCGVPGDRERDGAVYWPAT